MYSNIPNESKLNSFTPVRIPKVRDIFRRRGHIHSCDTASSLDSRNPIEHFDSENRRMNDYYYEQYRQQVESSANEVESHSSNESDDSTDD